MIKEGTTDGSFRTDVDPKIASIFILSILNAIERWYRHGGRLSRNQLVAQLTEFCLNGIS